MRLVARACFSSLPTLRLLLLLLLLSTAAASPAAAAPSAAQLQADISAAIAARKPAFAIPPGVYRFGAQPLTLTQARNFSLEGQGATLLFDGLAATGGVLLDGAQDVTVRDITIDYSPAPFYQGTLLSAPSPSGSGSGGSRAAAGDGAGPACVAAAQTDAGTIAPDVFLTRWLGNPKAEFVQGPQFWKANESFAQASVSTFLTPADFVQGDCAANGTCHVRVPCGQGLVPGDKVSVVVRTGFTYLLHNASRVTTENVTMHSALRAGGLAGNQR